MANLPVYFHPKDTATETTDALFIGLDSGASKQFRLIALPVSDSSQPVADGTPLEVWGYPRANIMQGKDIAPQLTCVLAKAMNVPLRDSRPTNYLYLPRALCPQFIHQAVRLIGQGKYERAILCEPTQNLFPVFVERLF